jgi:glycosyltransferase involved in cell wall biosynthesis
MKIGIDGRYAEGDLVGVGNYIKNLAEGLVKRKIECFIFYSQKPRYKIDGIKEVILSSLNRYVFEQVLLPLSLKENKIDVYHAVGNWGVPLLSSIPTVLTVHDIIPYEFKNYFQYARFPFISKLSYKFRLLTSCAKAKKIITVSRFVKKELVNKLKINSEKIEVVYSGVKIGKEGKLPKDLVGQKYILNHSGIDIRKNQQRLIEAFRAVKKKFPDLKLVITGKNPYMDLRQDKSIIYTGYVKEDILWALIKNAACICYPSLTEGFGMPVLEGFMAGVPVICSNTTAFPEIAGGAALLVNPYKEKEIAAAMGKILVDKNLAENLIQKGRKRAKEFTWDKAVEKTLKIYESVR